MEHMKLSATLLFCLFFTQGYTVKEPVVTAEKYIFYKKQYGHITNFTPPKVVLICYQKSTLNYFLKKMPDLKECESFSGLYYVDDIAIFGGWGWGAPALAAKVEELIALGATKFIAVGTAGALMNRHQMGDFIIAPKALGEDGVAHHYLQGKSSASATEEMVASFTEFAKKNALPTFKTASAWSFSAIFKETPEDILRVVDLGYEVVEMEAATLYAIGEEKNVKTLSLFVISDSLTLDDWVPHIKEPTVRNNLHQLADWALDFCQESVQS